MQISEEVEATKATSYAPRSTRSCVSVYVREVRDVAVGLFPRRLFVRVWLDTSFPLRMNEDTEFATSAVTIRRKSPGPQRFALEAGQSNTFSLPDYVVVCDICEIRRYLCCGEGFRLISRVRIPLSRTKFDVNGWSELWYSFHYSLKERGARAGRFAGRILVALHYESDNRNGDGAVGALATSIGALTPRSTSAPPNEAGSAQAVPDERKSISSNIVPEHETKSWIFGEKPVRADPFWGTLTPRGSTMDTPAPLITSGSRNKPAPSVGI